jgi:hypothetical protein
MSASSELRRVLVALNTRTGYEQTVAKLLELGADPFAVNDIGLTALLNAEGNWAGSAPPWLLAIGAAKRRAFPCYLRPERLGAPACAQWRLSERHMVLPVRKGMVPRDRLPVRKGMVPEQDSGATSGVLGTPLWPGAARGSCWPRRRELLQSSAFHPLCPLMYTCAAATGFGSTSPGQHQGPRCAHPDAAHPRCAHPDAAQAMLPKPICRRARLWATSGSAHDFGQNQGAHLGQHQGPHDHTVVCHPKSRYTTHGASFLCFCCVHCGQRCLGRAWPCTSWTMRPCVCGRTRPREAGATVSAPPPTACSSRPPPPLPPSSLPPCAHARLKMRAL